MSDKYKFLYYLSEQLQSAHLHVSCMVAEGGRTRLYREGHFRPGIRKFLRETQYISLCGRFFTFLCRSVLKEKPVCDHLHLFSAILDYNFSLLTTLVHFTSLWPSPSFTSLPDSDVSRFSRILPAGVINVSNQQILLPPPSVSTHSQLNEI